MAGGNSVIDPINSKNIELSESAKTSLKAAGVEIQYLDQLVSEFVKLAAIPKQLKELSEKLSNLSAADLKSNARSFGLSSGSVHSARLENRRVSWEVKDGNLTYDFDELIAGLPFDMTFIGASVMAVNAGGEKTSTGGNSAVLPLPANAETAFIQANIQTKDGPLKLTTTVQVPTEGSGKPLLATEDYTTGKSTLSVDEHIEILSGAVKTLQQQVR